MNIINPISTTSLLDTELSDEAFGRISVLAHKFAGIVLTDSKKSMVKSRLTRRLRALKMNSYADYLALLEASNSTDEREEFISCLTTNVSHFFREQHHFDYLAKSLLPNIQSRLEQGAEVRLWSAGCSNGQEPYSIAITALDHLPASLLSGLKILATDIDPTVLAHAKSACYPETMTTGLSEAQKDKYFHIQHENGSRELKLNQDVRNLVTFKKLNLHETWPIRTKFDAIFCRNVVIYFDYLAQEALFQKFAKALSRNGVLMLGHSERLTDGVQSSFTNVGVTTYMLNEHGQRANAPTINPKKETK